MNKRPYLLGLTGSIAAGKSTTARLFAEENVPVWDADNVVRGLYAKGGAAVDTIKALAPSAVSGAAVDRDALRSAIASDPSLLTRIESAVHPLVTADRLDFVRKIVKNGTELAIFDIPLLFETAADEWLDGVLVVTVPGKIQKARLLQRSGMSPKMLQAIRARQLPDAQKVARADFVIDTGAGIEAARTGVKALIHKLRRENIDA